MYEKYKELHPVHVDSLNVNREMTYSTGPFMCYPPEGGIYAAGRFPFMSPIWHTDWRDETLSWHLTCSFHTHLNPSPVTVIKGPDARRFFKENFVNNADNFPIGIIKHGIMCLENGLIATHGLIMRTGEDEYEAWWHAPYIEYAFQRGDYNAELIDLSSKIFLFQLQGPRVLEILERVTEEDLHDIKYRHFRESTVDGHKIRVVRLGMSGTLAYEIHGETQHAQEIYKKIMEIGNAYGIRRLGIYTYALNHCEGGFAQAGNNFMSASFLDEDFQKYCQERTGAVAATYELDNTCAGSAGPNVMKHVFNPFEVGLGHCINWNHEFVGKKALLEYKNNQKRNLTTLEWSPDDLAAIYRSQFCPGEENIRPMDFPGFEGALTGGYEQVIDLILDENDNEIGLSFARTHSHYYRAMISLASLDLDYHEIGKEVHVLWGEPGTKQMKIRARVAPYPYNQEIKNEDFDVESIPHYIK